MSEHYYTENPTSGHDERRIALRALGRELIFTTDAGVFSRDGLDRGTEVLLDALPELSGRVLDLGCGWGAVGVALGKKYPGLEIVMTDINRRAVELGPEPGNALRREQRGGQRALRPQRPAPHKAHVLRLLQRGIQPGHRAHEGRVF